MCEVSGVGSKGDKMTVEGRKEKLPPKAENFPRYIPSYEEELREAVCCA
jgi:hypothetical protein